MPNLGTLTLDLIAKTGGFTGPLDKAGRHHKKTAKQIEQEQKALNQAFKTSMVSIGKWGAATAVAAAAGAIAMTKASFAAADVIGKTADAAGVTTDSLQEMRYAAQISGMSIEDLDKSIMGFGKRIGELRAGTGSLYTILDKTNKAFLDQVKTAPSVDAALDIVMGAMAGTADDADRAALAVAAFGRSGQKMGILSKEYKNLRVEAQELGLIIDEHLIRSAEKTNDQMTALSMIVKTQLTAGILELAPYIQEIVSDMTDWIKSNKDFLSQDIPNYIKKFAQEVRWLVNSPAFDAFKKYWEIIAGASVGMVAGGPLGALLGAGAGAGVSIYRDLSAYFEETFPEKIRNLKKEIADLNSELKTAPLYSTIFVRGANDVKARRAELEEELAANEKLFKAQQEVLVQVREKAKAEGVAAEAVKLQAAAYERLAANMKDMKGISLDFEVAKVQKEIADAEILTSAKIPFKSGAREAIQIDLKARKEYLQQLLILQGKEDTEHAKHNAAILALDQKVYQQLELIGLDGYQKQLKILDQKQKEELEQYRKAGADILALERLHAEQRKALKEGAAKELMSHFTAAPGFSGTGGAFGELGMLEQQREDLNKWYVKQNVLLEQYRQERVDLNEEWNEKELQIEQEHSERLARIEQARTQLILASNASMFESLADIQKTFSDEQNSTYKTLFAISKLFTIAEITLNMYDAISDAWATGATVADKVAAASMVAGGMLTIVQSAQAVGMAHDGIDSVPETGTWLLQKGERVVAERTSKRLDETLSRLQSGNWNINIHEAPGTAAQVIRRSDGLDVQIALIEEKLTERMGRGAGMAGALDRRYGRRG